MYISSLSYATSSTAISFPNFQLNRHSRKPPSPSANFFSHYSFSKRPASLNSVGCSLYRPGHFSAKKFGFKQGLKYSRMTNQCLESSNEQLDEFVKIANRVADAAGQVIRQYFRKNVDILDKEVLSPVTIADRAAEEVMRVIISEHFPTHAIFGEENGWTSKEENAEYVWVLDPIDGTKSFITGKPLFGTLTALVQNDKPEKSGRDMEKMISSNENAPTIKDWNYEQIKLYLADFSSTNSPLQNSFANSINNRLQNV